jgi:NTP pyrophosphatase (non-canonical NTP hydrolase)
VSVEDSIPWCSTGDEFDDLWDESPWSREQPEAVPDILCTMFNQQRKHMGAYQEIGHTTPEPHEWGDLNSRRIQAALREFAGYTVEELYEAINNLKNKPWKQTDRPTDVEAFKEELADAWHFFIEFHILAGIDPEEVFRSYFRKTFVNVNRQQNGY